MLPLSNIKSWAVLDQVLSGFKKKPQKNESGQSALEDDGYVPFKLRFQAWWEGEEPKDLLLRKNTTDQNHRTPDSLVIDETANKIEEDATPNRLAVWRHLWGDDHHLPGGEEFVLSLIQPCMLKPKMAVFDINAGLGGGARAIARAHDVPVTGLEANKDLAAAGMALSKEQDCADKVPIKAFGIEDMKLPKAEVDCVLAREFMFTVEDKIEILKLIRDGLKVKGHLVATDYVLFNEDKPGPEFAAWREAEPVTPYPWTLEKYKEAMKRIRLELRTFEDITDRFCAMALEAWDDFVRNMDDLELERPFTNAMLLEAELWQKRIHALKGGQLRVLHLHGVKRETGTLSEW